ncbi:MAG TPA: ABC transporter ATP-binding protein [Candidatus Paceibacterota bacterium]|nr:ABC transporter ATP-binding protein [Candidatus Paceibacterota bacterium]
MVDFSHLTKAYKKKVVVDDFTLSVDVPIFGFLGQNGAGKTTIMKMIVGLLEPTSGSITIDGALSSHPIFKKKLGYMPETPYFYERMTGMEFLRFCDELFEPSGGKTPQYEEILKKVGIYAARNAEIRTYSKGMRQRLGFAQSLVNDPEYLFLDEPLDGLDPIGRREMKEVMLALKHEGRRIFLNTHILADVEEICDEVGIVHKGKLLYAGSVKAFCAGKPLEERFMEAVQQHEMQERLGPTADAPRASTSAK